VLEESGTGRGVLLLNPTSVGSGVELVYLGLAPSARGRGIGDQLMRLGIGAGLHRGFSDLSVAVDSRNRPALSLYFRYGLVRAGMRSALVRNLTAG
jgi:ribosomal protein S18 acetylase RimI-like enzyme